MSPFKGLELISDLVDRGDGDCDARAKASAALGQGASFIIGSREHGSENAGCIMVA